MAKSRTELMVDRLRDLQATTPEIEGAGVVSVDGLIMASSFPAGVEEDRRAGGGAMSAHPPVVELLRRLIAIPSPNPPGDCRAIADFCEAFLKGCGFTTLKVAPDERAWSVVGVAGRLGVM